MSILCRCDIGCVVLCSGDILSGVGVGVDVVVVGVDEVVFVVFSMFFLWMCLLILVLVMVVRFIFCCVVRCWMSGVM